jgi:type II secretory pathway pseudopilin PulG
MLSQEALRSDRGATLIEVLVAASMSVLVAGALMGILTISTHQSKLLTDRVQANRTARTTMNKLVNPLHSACLAAGFAPIRSPAAGRESGPSKLIFVNAYTTAAAIPSATEKPGEGAYLHEVEYSAASHKLIDKAYPSTSVASWPEITFSATSKQTVLGENVFPTEIAPKEAAPIFEFYKYAEKASAESATAPVGTLESMGKATVLTETTAKQAASVLIRFTMQPVDGDTRASRGVALSNQVTFAFSAPGAETPITDAPCE